MLAQPAYYSLALRDIPQPDFADVMIAPLPPGAPTCPRQWAESMANNMPPWVVAALAIRQAIVPLLGIPPAPRDVFRVRYVEGQEALMSADDKHLDFRCALGVDPVARLVRISTTVKLKGWRGRLYFAPVRLAHPIVVAAMLKRAQRDLRASVQFY